MYTYHYLIVLALESCREEPVPLPMGVQWWMQKGKASEQFFSALGQCCDFLSVL